MFHYVYILETLKDKKLYIGYTTVFVRRTKEHNQGLNFSTRPKRPWRLIYCEACLNEDDAKRREKYLKTSQGYRLLKA